MRRSLSVLILFISLLVIAGCASTATQPPPPIELRGAWLTDTTLFSTRESITAAMQFLADHNFNAVFPVVWNGGATLFPSKVMRQWFGATPSNGGRDPLAEVIEEAHKRNIAVIAAFAPGSGATPPEEERVLRKKPHWRARDRNGNAVKKDGIEWINPLHPEVQEFLLALVSEVARDYPVDGILGGDRVLAEPIEAGYDSITVSLYRETHSGNLPPEDVAETHWKYWRAVQINTFARKVYWRAKAFKARFVMGWAPLPYRDALNGYLQDWRSWITEDPYGGYYADFIVPLISAVGIETYKRTLDAQHKDTLRIKQKNRYLFPGILLKRGDVVATADELLEALRYNRFSGYNGEVISSLDVLRAESNKLAAALKQTYYSRPARLPFAVPAREAR